MSEPTAPRARRPWRALPIAVAVVAALGGVVAYRSMGDDVGVGLRDTSRSASVAWSVDGRSLWLTSPDDDRVLELDGRTLAVRREVAVAGQPQELTVTIGRILVTSAQRTDLAVVSTGPDGAPTRHVELPCGGSHSVVEVPAGTGGARSDLAVVSCPSDDRLAVVDLDAGATVARISLRGRPTGVVRDGHELTVSTAGDGRLRTWDLADLVGTLPTAAPRPDQDVPVLDLPKPTVVRAWADGRRTASSLAPLAVSERGVVGAYQVVDNLGALTPEQVAADATYGRPVGGRARIEPAVAGPCGARFADLGVPARWASGPVALAASPGSDLVWVVGQFTHSVSVVRCTGGDPAGRSLTVASFDVGAGARGIVLAPDGRRAYVDVGFDHAVAELVLPLAVDGRTTTAARARRAPARVVRRPVGDQHLSPLAQEGRRMFTDATDPHLTPLGVVTCASCHPSAGDDGLRWRIEARDIAAKVRRTPALWQAGATDRPLHWDGGIATVDDLTASTIHDLLGGDGLLVDPSAISAYLAETPPPPARPARTTGERAARDRGEELFGSTTLGCASCHAGATGSDGRPHDVLVPAGRGPARLDAVVTPPLLGERAKAPYGHDGRAPDLATLLRAHRDADGAPFDLADRDLADLIAYLESR